MKKLFFILLALTLVFPCVTDAQNRIETNPQSITINVPDTVVNSTILKRKATLFTMIYNQSAKSLSLTWTVRYYSDSLGLYGSDISDIIPDYARTSIADNDVFVNPANGAIIDGVPTIDYMGQYDWFNMVAESMSINVHAMIRQYGLAITNWNK